MIIDLVILLALGGGFYYGFKKGALYSVLSFFGVFAGFLIAMKCSEMFSIFLAEVIDINRALLPPIAFLVLFIGMILSFKAMAWVLEGALKLVMLNIFNKIMGGLLWVLLSLILTSACLWFLDTWTVLPVSVTNSSILYPQVKPLTPILTDQIGKAIPLFEGMFDTIESLLDEVV
jgi:uncharacterized membrane protein required for colicin V production